MSKQLSEYTFDDYQRIHNLVMEYQAGAPQSADKLIEAFNGFLWRFVNYIHQGVFSIDNYCLRKFVSLFIADENVRKRVAQYRFRPVVQEYLYNLARRVNVLFSQYTEEEIRQEAICTLLTMAKKYKDTQKPSFHNYVEKCFHFEAFRGLKGMIIDPITRLPQDEYIDNLIIDASVERDFNDFLVEIDYERSLKGATIPVEQVKSSPFDLDSLNTNWNNGVTCGDAFKNLSPFERSILVMHYIEDLTDTEIGEQYGLCRATINRKRLTAKAKIAENVNSDTFTETVLLKESV